MIYDSFISILVFSLSCIHFSVAAPVISYNVKSNEDKAIQKRVTGKTKIQKYLLIFLFYIVVKTNHLNVQECQRPISYNEMRQLLVHSPCALHI